MIHEPTAAEAHHNLGLGALTNAIEMDVHRMAPDKRMTGSGLALTGIEPATFGTGIRRAAIAPQNRYRLQGLALQI